MQVSMGKFLIVSFAALMLPDSVLPAERSWVSSPRRELVAPELRDAPEEWIERSLGWAGDILSRFPPGVPEHPVRRAALIRLDDVLHIESAPAKPLVQQFFRTRLEEAVQQIEQTPVREGMRIWKLYNHGFLVRTAAASFTLDIVPGTQTPGFVMAQDLLDRLARQSDATFVSHVHVDHASAAFAQLFVDQGKPVIAPEGLWSGQPRLTRSLTHLSRDSNRVQRIVLRSGKTLTVSVYPGHQGTIPNNVYVISSPDGFTVVHTGDQAAEEAPGGDFDWIAQIGGRHEVDILLPNCWTTNIQRMARGVNPQLIITGHENEMGHTVDHREDYTQTYNHLFGMRYPFLVMAWGESYHYLRPSETQRAGLRSGR